MAVSPEAQAALDRAAEVSADADAALAASYARRVPEVDPLEGGWRDARAPSPEVVRRSMAAPEQRRAPAARTAARKPPPITRRSLERWADMIVRTVGLAVRKQLDRRDAENRELARLVQTLARRVDALERERRP